MKQKFLIILILLLLGCYTNAEKPYFSLDVAKNAAMHNNLGLERLQDGYYDMALAEFKLAIELNPESKACAVYYNNIGDTYMKLSKYANAQAAYENAIKISPLSFLYYKNVVQSYKMQGILKSKIKQYQEVEEKSSLYKLMLGLCYIESGDLKRGIIKLDEFVMQEPYLITSSGVKKYLKEITQDNY